MRNHDSPEPLVILASASDLLLRATDGMLVDGEACTLPQLEVINYECFFISSDCKSVMEWISVLAYTLICWSNLIGYQIE